MSGRKSKSKGSRFELAIAKKFKEWWGEGEWRRTPGSGGWARAHSGDDFNASGDIVTTAEGFPFCIECFPSGTRVLTSVGYRNIEDIQEGDEVVTHTGENSTVDGCFSRIASSLVNINPYYSLPIKTTKNHPIYTNRGWVAAENLTSDDFLLFPLGVQLNYQSEFILPVREVYENTPINGYIDCGGKTKYKLPKRINVTPAFAELVGWYLAEGYCNEGGVFFTLSFEEEKEAKRIVDLVSCLFNIEAKVHYVKNTIRVSANSVLLSEFFSSVFGRVSEEKTFSSILGMPVNCLVALLGGYWDGDGHSSENGSMAVTTSIKLAEELCLSFNRLGIPCGFYERKKEPWKVIYCVRIPVAGENKAFSILSPVSRKFKFPRRLTKQHLDNHQIINKEGVEYLATRIASIEVIEEEAVVYNLSVNNQSTYIVDRISVHNCKHQESWALDHFLSSISSKPHKWLEQAIDETPKGSYALLAFHRNRAKTLVAFEYAMFGGVLQAVDFPYFITTYNREGREYPLIFMTLDNFFTLDPDLFKCYNEDKVYDEEQGK